MPWLTEAMKDAASRDRPGRGAHSLRPRGVRMGQPAGMQCRHHVWDMELTRGTETS